MSEEKYFIISRFEDEVRFDVLTREDLSKRLQEEVDEEITTNYIDDAISIDGDMGYFPSCSTLIIKGKVVVPVPIEVVRKLEID